MKGRWSLGSVADPDSLSPDPDPAFQVNPDPDQVPAGFDDQKLKKIQQLKKLIFLL
jgi:hypothetical protein